ncbi:hypothetical protein [Amycolatopsis magusensis]|uniref:MFS family permease n=1 Tax=Amycolatopsis magusensis TaxID=882444 RepID=A0ABS4PHT2_9PSEU|nr:hypothetical protein [Amycolatopsis magusensis]MBP2178979.1 MFS family permease [Amycolatopsis magusensis]
MTSLRERFSSSWAKQLEIQERKESERARKLLRWRTRRHRRRITLLLLLGNLIIIGAALIVQQRSWWLFAVLWFGGLLVWTAGFVLLRVLTGRMSTAFSALLDERERAWRHRINYIGYQAMFFLVAIAFGYLMVIADTAGAAYRGAMMLAALTVLGASTPTFVLGWSLPDDDPEDFIEPGTGEESDV